MDAIVKRKIIAVLKSIAPEMRREHDIGDGHFSTSQVETVEALIAELISKSPITYAAGADSVHVSN